MKNLAKQIILCASGTIMEWYDFSLFASLAAIMSEIFFPNGDKFSSMMSTFALFASGFIMRPIGAVFFGHLGDRIGRKSTLLITLFIMTISTSAIGFLPAGYVLSVILLVVFRLAQGFAASGEYPGGITLLSEQVDVKKRGLVSSFGIFAAPAGICLGTMVCAAVAKLVGHHNMVQWGWRIPFLISAPLGLIGYWIRKSLLESEQFQMIQRDRSIIKIPLFILIEKYYREFIVLSGFYILSSVSFYINFIYLTNYAVNSHNFDMQALYVNVIVTLIYALAILVFGWLSAYIGSKALMACSCVLIIFLAYPLFVYILNGNSVEQILGQLLISILIGMFVGPLASVTADFFPTQIRYTGVSLSLNCATAIFGGTAPIICAWLVKISNSAITPVYYFIAIGVIALIMIIFMTPRIKKSAYLKITNSVQLSPFQR
jgi:MHS family proline/betaine transporter-like MFS transporter